MDPGPHPAGAAEVAGKHIRDAAVNDRSGVALQGAPDGHDVTADLPVRSEMHLAEHRDSIPIDLAVDVRVAEDGDGVAAYLACDLGIADNRDDVSGLAFAGRRTKNGND
jgi:hypothetical protein